MHAQNDTNPVLVFKDEGVTELTLNRPRHLNALNKDMIARLNEIVGEVECDSSVRCVIIKGSGDHFMAGGDIGYFNQLLDCTAEHRIAAFKELIGSVHEFVCRLAALPVPVIASVKGAAAGFGLSLVAGSDLAVAANTSKFTSAYTFLGTSPDGGSTFYLPRSVGLKKAMEMVLISDRFDAGQALQLGLVNSVVNDDELDSATRAMAAAIAASPRAAVRNAKSLLRQSFERDLETQLEHELDCFIDCAKTDDFEEGVRAFVGKRKPQFKA